MKPFASYLCGIISFAVLGANAQPAGETNTRVFKAGAATSNITPPLGVGIVGGWDTPPATHIHDELHARCLVLDDGKTRLAIAVCDNVSITREEVNITIAAKNGRTGQTRSVSRRALGADGRLADGRASVRG